MYRITVHAADRELYSYTVEDDLDLIAALTSNLKLNHEAVDPKLVRYLPELAVRYSITFTPVVSLTKR
jgi:hypothetical protein